MHYGIIAAGEGSRLAQEGATRPKPLIELEGKPLVDRLIDIFTAQGAESVSIIVNEQMTEVQQHVKALAEQSRVPIHVIIKSTPSSMHSFYELSRHMERGGRFILTTVDTVFRPDDFASYAQAFAEAPAEIDAMMAMTSYIDDEKPLYIATDSDNKITAFLDEKREDVRYVSGGIYGLGDAAVKVLEHCMATGVSRMRNFQRELLTAGLNVQGYDFGKILDVDHVGDIVKAEKFLKNE